MSREAKQIDDGGPAYPFTPTDPIKLSDGSWTSGGVPGMPLRDRFAGLAMASLPHIGCGADLDVEDFAAAAFQLADAMFEARKGGAA